MQVKIGMNKSLLLFLFFVLHVFEICAQELTVKSFKVSDGDILARTAATCRYDTNDKYCALIKVGITLDGVEFECSGGVRDVVKKTGEYWVYLPQNNSKMRILHKDYTPLEINFYDYGIGKVQSGVTYVLTLLKPMGQNSGISPQTLIVSIKDGVNIEMIKVEAGTFMMGASPEMKSPEGNEKPWHQVTLTNDYFIGKYEVTQSLWQAVMGSNPSSFKGDNLPVENISWIESQEFIRKINSVSGKSFRLPTEAEWEYAARGGKYSRNYLYSGSDNISDVAWYKDNSGGVTHPVGLKQPNELGLFDMSGNVNEWCQDWFGAYSSSPKNNPIGAETGNCRVGRGGGWFNITWNNLSVFRNFCPPNKFGNVLGFRLVLSE